MKGTIGGLIFHGGIPAQAGVRYRYRILPASRGGRLQIITAIEDPAVIAKILTHLHLPARAPPRSTARRLDLFQAA
jgi:hypothetical protein